MRSVLLIDVVGLTQRQIGEDSPNLRALAMRGAGAPMTTVLPAVTCSAQATMLTGLSPAEHGAVGNGWLDPKTREIALWRQANHLVSGEKIYEAARKRDASFTCSKLFWWWNLGAQVDWSITPRPYYPADGRKIPAVYAWPSSYGSEMEDSLGKFPFFDFWGPKAGLPSSRWIADAAIRTLRTQRPTLTMAYLPHLDYDQQRFGPHDARSRKALADIDVVIGDMIAAADEVGAETVVVSEYGIMPVDKPVAINLALRDAGLLQIRETPNGEVLDPFGSDAFAVVDHQLAHVYCKTDAARARATEALSALDGVDALLQGDERARAGLANERAGDLIAIASKNAWFSYYYWRGDAAQPDFAPTVDIHRKPGYDPCEMFLNPELRFPKLRVARRLAQKFSGMRYLMDVIPTDASLVRGSHGRLPEDPLDGPVFLCSQPFDECGGDPQQDGVVAMESVKERVLDLMELPRAD
ncbi:MAG: putative AlkP superfamily pyrophosphatase or phosphodiesterase [Planctomycetota bacterium]|jgi:predicted AlkP superfamily pyrophosphatase or phosphodiesterase